MPVYFPVKSRGVGLPDYSQPKPVGQVPVGPVYTSTDMAELAARLGSIITHDRRGNVIWFDDFESALKWHIFGIAGHSGDLSTVMARNGNFSLKLTTPAVAGGYSCAGRAISYPNPGILGFEVSFCFSRVPGAVTDTAEYINLAFATNNPTENIFASFYYYTASRELRVRTPDRDQVVATMWLRNESMFNIFHTVKLVVDFENHKYIRLICDAREFDISQYNVRLLASSGASEYMTLSFEIAALGATAAYCYFDDAIVTQNEPGTPAV